MKTINEDNQEEITWAEKLASSFIEAIHYIKEFSKK